MSSPFMSQAAPTVEQVLSDPKQPDMVKQIVQDMELLDAETAFNYANDVYQIARRRFTEAIESGSENVEASQHQE